MIRPDHQLPQVEISHPLGTWWGEETHPEWLSSSPCTEEAISVSFKISSYKLDRHYAECGRIFQNSKIRFRECLTSLAAHLNHPQGLLNHRLLGPATQLSDSVS